MIVSYCLHLESKYINFLWYSYLSYSKALSLICKACFIIAYFLTCYFSFLKSFFDYLNYFFNSLIWLGFTSPKANYFQYAFSFFSYFCLCYFYSSCIWWKSFSSLLIVLSLLATCIASLLISKPLTYCCFCLFLETF